MESPENFLNVISKIKRSYKQGLAVENGLKRLFEAKKYGSVISLVKALESRSFEGIDLEKVIEKHLGKEYVMAAKILWRHFMDTLQSHPKYMPMD